MHQTSCSFCGAVGPKRDDPFDAADAACVDAGFVKLEIPDLQDPRRKRFRFLCAHCATYVRTYFITERPRAESVLVPLEDDLDFEDNNEW